MKSSPYGEKRSGEMDMKPRIGSNFDKSGMKNADGSSVKPGAPGLFGRIAKGVLTGGMSEVGRLFGKKKKDAAAAAGAQGAGAGAVDPATGAPVAAPGAAAVPTDEQAGPVAPPAGAPVDPNAVA